MMWHPSLNLFDCMCWLKTCKVSVTNLVGRICLLSLQCVIVMWFSLLKRGDQKGNSVLRCQQGAACSWVVVLPDKESALHYLPKCGDRLRMFHFMLILLVCVCWISPFVLWNFQCCLCIFPHHGMTNQKLRLCMKYCNWFWPTSADLVPGLWLEGISTPMLGVFNVLTKQTSWDNGGQACGMLEVLHWSAGLWWTGCKLQVDNRQPTM